MSEIPKTAWLEGSDTRINSLRSLTLSLGERLSSFLIYICRKLRCSHEDQEFLNQIYILMVDCSIMNWADRLDDTQSVPDAQSELRTLANLFINTGCSRLLSVYPGITPILWSGNGEERDRHTSTCDHCSQKAFCLSLHKQ